MPCVNQQDVAAEQVDNMFLTAYCPARSVLIHALPGMALLAHRHCPVPPAVLAVVERWSPAVASWAGARTAIVEASRAATEGGLLWTAAAPLAFYAIWQLVYWLIVQVSQQNLASDAWLDDMSCRCLVLPESVQRGSFYTSLLVGPGSEWALWVGRCCSDDSFSAAATRHPTAAWRGVRRGPTTGSTASCGAAPRRAVSAHTVRD